MKEPFDRYARVIPRRTILVAAAVVFLAALFPLLGIAAALVAIGYGLAQPSLRTLTPTPRSVIPRTQRDL
jgi:hypothetical protein